MEESTAYTLYKVIFLGSFAQTPITLLILLSLSLPQENCWFFCSVTVDLLASERGGKFDKGYRLEHASSAAKERKAIRTRWKAMKG